MKNIYIKQIQTPVLRMQLGNLSIYRASKLFLVSATLNCLAQLLNHSLPQWIYLQSRIR